MGREHILAKKRMYLLIQGTSDFHRESPLQVVRGRSSGGACRQSYGVAGGGGWVGAEKAPAKKGKVLVALQAQ